MAGTIDFVPPGVEATISNATLLGLTKKDGSGQMQTFTVTRDMTESQIAALSGVQSWKNLGLIFDTAAQGQATISFTVDTKNRRTSKHCKVKQLFEYKINSAKLAELFFYTINFKIKGGNKMEFKTWLYDWLKLYVKPNVKDRTLYKYENQIRLHINPNIGDYELNELNADILQKFVIDMIDKKLSTNTINSIISIIKSSLKRAVLLGKIEKEYSNAIVRPKQTEKPIECFTREEQKKIEDFVVSKNKQNYFGIVLCLYTGLRIGELLALTWDDINLQKGIMLITKNSYDSWNNGKYEKVIDSTKTINSQRLMPLPKQLLSTLKELKKQTKSKYVVVKDKDYGIQIRTYQKFFSNMLKKLNIKHKGFHSLRHTFATRALECGMDIKTLSEILGHKNPTITLKRYAHSLLEHKTEMMNKLGKLFSLQ